MGRQPARRRRGPLRSRPVSFSSFARTVDRVASTSKVIRSATSKMDRKVPPKDQENEITRHTSKEKIERSESSSEDENGGTIQLDFDFFDLKPNDFHGLKMLLQTYLDDKQWELSGFVDLLLGQTTVGTVVKIEDEEDEKEDCLYSVVTVLNLGHHKDHRSILDIKEFLCSRCKDKDVIGDLQNLLEEQAQNVGLLVSKHVVNFPPELLPPLYDGVFTEVARAAKDQPKKELRQYYSFKTYLLITRIYEHKNIDHQKGKTTRSTDEPIIYIWHEDEIFHKLSSWSFSFPLRTRQTNELKNYRPMGLVMAVKAEKIPIFQEQLQSLISGC